MSVPGTNVIDIAARRRDLIEAARSAIASGDESLGEFLKRNGCASAETKGQVTDLLVAAFLSAHVPERRCILSGWLAGSGHRDAVSAILCAIETAGPDELAVHLESLLRFRRPIPARLAARIVAEWPVSRAEGRVAELFAGGLVSTDGPCDRFAASMVREAAARASDPTFRRALEVARDRFVSLPGQHLP